MKKIMFLLSAAVVMVLLFAPVAMADHHTAMSTATGSAMMSASSSASATSSATASATASASASTLTKTGGAPLIPALALMASMALVGSGVGALVLVRRGASS